VSHKIIAYENNNRACTNKFQSVNSDSTAHTAVSISISMTSNGQRKKSGKMLRTKELSIWTYCLGYVVSAFDVSVFDVDIKGKSVSE
jgi:hypothetical protein